MFNNMPPPVQPVDMALLRLYFASDREEDASSSDGLTFTRENVLRLTRDFVNSAASPFAELGPEDALRARHGLHCEWSDLTQPNGPFPQGKPLGRDEGVKAAMVLDCLALAAHELLLRRCPPPPDPSHIADRLRARRLYVRPRGLEKTPMRMLKSDKIHKLIAVRGSVIRVSSLRPMVSTMRFKCPRCGCTQDVPLTDGKYVPPEGCNAHGCKARQLDIHRSHSATRDWQKIRLQEVPDEEAARGTDQSAAQVQQEFYGRVPRSVEVELLDELVDCCVPGDLVVVTGLVKCLEVAAEGGGGGGRGASSNRPRCMYLLYIEALTVSSAKAAIAEVGGAAGGPRNDSALSFSMMDLMGIRDIAGEPNLFHLLVHSFAPAIFGHETVKSGLLLGLLGGTAPGTAVDSAEAMLVGTRADVHVLVVGDPGMGKSQMLISAASLAPRGVYVCGNTSSSSGLTVTVVKDAITGDFALEAGALVMGDQGVCCIDEFDKMSGNEHQALLEAMEQQSISIAKAGIVCSLSARTAVLAAANPIGGHYNRAKTVCENLKLPPNILSRFDLIFVLLDRPNEQMDKMLSEHVMALHGAPRGGGAGGGRRGGGGARAPSGADQMPEWEGEDGYAEWCQAQPLAQRLRARSRDLEPVPGPLLRKYIAYARAYCHPTLSADARSVLSDFYLSMRATQRGGDSVPVTTRQLESLVRLAEARARAELREEVTRQDAADAVDIVKETIMYDTLADVMGGLGAPPMGSNSQLGAGGSGRGGVFGGGGGAGGGGGQKVSIKRVRDSFVAAMHNFTHNAGDNVMSTAQLQQVFQSTGHANPKPTFGELLDWLNNQGDLLIKPGGKWLVVGSAVQAPSQRVAR